MHSRDDFSDDNIQSIDNQFVSRKDDMEKDEVIEVAFNAPESSRASIIFGIVESYFSHYGLEMPPDVFNLDYIHLLTSPQNKAEVITGLDKVKKYAEDYVLNSVHGLELEDVQVRVIKNIINKTMFGTRIEEMSPNPPTSNNLKNGLIYNNVLNFILLKVFAKKYRFKDEYHPDIFRLFQKQGVELDRTIATIDWVKNQLRKTLNKKPLN
jgi:hypothetical protein